ncbi:uncharacterized protein [Heterodontus francisci]|uniref:uncharacterized protein isoform X4 n=1 Tax=Heterodontus francisci TaxID=7792 RepID=UPI00355C9596
MRTRASTPTASFSHNMRKPAILLIKDIYYPFVAALGVLVNLVTIMILARRNCGLSKCISVYMVAMATADLLVLIINVIVYRIFSYHFPFSFLTYSPVCRVILYLCTVSFDLTVWFTVFFTFDRFVAVCFEKFKARYCTARNAGRCQSFNGHGYLAGCHLSIACFQYMITTLCSIRLPNPLPHSASFANIPGIRNSSFEEIIRNCTFCQYNIEFLQINERFKMMRRWTKFFSQIHHGDNEFHHNNLQNVKLEIEYSCHDIYFNEEEENENSNT